MKKSVVNLEELLNQVSEEQIAAVVKGNDVKAAWGGDDDREEHDDDDREDDDEDECEIFEGNNGLHLGVFIH